MSVIRTSGEIVETIDAVVTRVEQDPRVVSVETKKAVVGGYKKNVYSVDIENRIAAVNDLKARLLAAEEDIAYLTTVAVDETTAEITRLDEARELLRQYVYDLEDTINQYMEIPEVAPVDWVTAELRTGSVQLEWAKVPFTAYYKVFLDNEVIMEAIDATSYTHGKPLLLGTRTFSVAAYSETDTPSTPASISIHFALAPITLSVELTTENTLLTWNDITYATGYKIEHNGVIVEHNTKSTSYVYKTLPSGDHVFKVYPITAAGEYGNPGVYTTTVEVPLHPIIDVEYSGEYIVLNWKESNSTYPIRHYIISHDNIVTTSKTTTYITKVLWQTNTITVQAVDTVGNTSLARTVTSVITPPSISSVTSEVIDNNILLYWDLEKSTLPIKEVEIRKGNEYATASTIGYRVGTFTTLFESVSGYYTYWFKPIDTAGNEGEEVQTTAFMSEPPDYVLNRQWYSDFSGTKYNCLVDPKNRLLMGISTSETYEEHFITNGFTSIQDQLDAGYPYYLQPNLLEAYYEEVFDHEAILSSTNISVTLTKEQIGVVNFQIDISTSPDGVVWTDYVNTSKALGTNFRYLKVRVSTTSDATGFMWLKQIEVKLDSKETSDAGRGQALAADINGTIVSFNKPFSDIVSLVVTPEGVTGGAKVAIYDFEDIGNPTTFSVYIYDVNGNRVDSSFSWTAKGY